MLRRGAERHHGRALELGDDLQGGPALVVPGEDVVDHADADVPGAVGESLAELVRGERLRRPDLDAVLGEEMAMLRPDDRRGRDEEDLANAHSQDSATCQKRRRPRSHSAALYS